MQEQVGTTLHYVRSIWAPPAARVEAQSSSKNRRP
jgi:hypothetical protein